MPATFEDALYAEDPTSPWFARVASECLARGDAAKALALCTGGRREFPRYVTGQLVQARCYHALGRRAETILEYEQVLAVFPSNAVVRHLLDAAHVEEDLEFEAFAARRRPQLLRERDSVSLEEYEGAPGVPVKESGVDFLLKQLQEVKKGARTGGTEEEKIAPREVGEGSGRIVTATLAEIYASQKEYREAIRAYRRLMEQRPAEAERFAQRVRELEDLEKAENSEKE
jgi:tetratricopeptide (TPR) repeat protein